ncbi:pIVa2 [bottlenose dolphin adenovirus 2]|uniref:Packaging protein 1 n=1 Tax=bottlenose dolphin adenovirus 2 TaxID=2849592 RepID=A0A0M5KZS2_9ADEN|nr:pIVa2 [Bottlenose dolphin adenovirus 1]ALE15294.1 pIVa2 [Bottlenose dolphin adenovirus 1]
METKDKEDDVEANTSNLSNQRSSIYGNGNNINSNCETLERHDIATTRSTSPSAVLKEQPKPKKHRSLYDEFTLGHVTNLWEKLCTLQESLNNMHYNEGLKALKNFNSIEELLSLGGQNLINELVNDNKKIEALITNCQPFLNSSGGCKSLNYFTQPVIGVIYGPTGCGKSQLLRNIISMQLLNPPPETVFFITPQVDMMPPQELSAWETQICEGNYTLGVDNTIVPQSGSLMPKFIKMSYNELTDDINYDVTNPNNVFAKAASTGPIAIILDECMEDLGNNKGVAKFFHAFPSKLHDRFPKCTGYAVLVVLHNMNPRKDQGGNISNLKIQSKLHIISPKMQPSQLNRFINLYTKGLPLPISLLLKDIFNFHRIHGKYDWIVYNTTPENEALQWLYMHPEEGLMPMYLNIQSALYKVLEKIHKVLINRARWTRYYHSKK